MDTCKASAIEPYNKFRGSLVAAYQAEVVDPVALDMRDKRVIADWSACMKQQGFEYSSLVEPELDIAKQYEQWMESAQTPNGTPGLADLTAAELTAITVLAKQERELAVIDATCWGSTVYPTEKMLTDEYDAIFSISHAIELRKLERFWITDLTAAELTAITELAKQERQSGASDFSGV